MNVLTSARLIITGIAIVVWGYGLKTENAKLRIVAMGLLAVSLALRFFQRKRREPSAPE